MTSRELYEYGLIELNKLEAPSLLLEDYVYFLNKAVQQWQNLTYNRYDINQQSSDDLRVLKTTVILKPEKLPESIINNIDSSILSNTYYVDLPKDYVHLLNCIIEFKRTNVPNKKTHCDVDEGARVYYTARRLTADMYGGVINNYYQKPTYKRPYYYLNTINPDPVIATSEQDRAILDYKVNLDEGSLINSQAETGNRLANPSTVRLELRFGDNDLYVPVKVYIEYIKAPMYIRLSQDDVESPIDNTNILEFPNYICYEILNIFVRLVMENASDPRLQTDVPINHTIPDFSQTGKQ